MIFCLLSWILKPNKLKTIYYHFIRCVDHKPPLPNFFCFMLLLIWQFIPAITWDTNLLGTS